MQANRTFAGHCESQGIEIGSTLVSLADHEQFVVTAILEGCSYFPARLRTREGYVISGSELADFAVKS